MIGLKWHFNAIIIPLALAACGGSPKPAAVIPPDPINCRTYGSFTIPAKAAVWIEDSGLDKHNLNEANFHACKLDPNRKGGPR